MHLKKKKDRIKVKKFIYKIVNIKSRNIFIPRFLLYIFLLFIFYIDNFLLIYYINYNQV